MMFYRPSPQKNDRTSKETLSSPKTTARILGPWAMIFLVEIHGKNFAPGGPSITVPAVQHGEEFRGRLAADADAHLANQFHEPRGAPLGNPPAMINNGGWTF